MCTARPEVGVAYRKSQRSQRAAEEASQKPPAPAAANPPAVPVPAAAPAAAVAAAAPATSPVSPAQSAASSRRYGVMAPPVHVADLPRRAAAPAAEVPRPAATTPARAIKRSRLSQPAPSSPLANSSTSPADRMDADNEASSSSAVPAAAVDHVTVTLQSTHELHAPLTTSATELTAAAEAEIAASKADVLRLREEALARSAAGESALEMGLVAAEPGISGGPGSTLASAGTGGLRGIKRTTEDVSIEEENADAQAAESSTGVTTVLANSGQGRVIAGNRRVVNPEIAVQRQGVWGSVAMAAGIAAGFFASNFLF